MMSKQLTVYSLRAGLCQSFYMKTLAVLFFALSVLSPIAAQEKSIRLGEKLEPIVKQQGISELLFEDFVLPIQECFMENYVKKGAMANGSLDPSEIVCIKINGQYAAIAQSVDDKIEYLFDVDGDGILESKTTSMLVPAWTFRKSKNLNKSSTNNVKHYLDTLMKFFNGNENPYQTGTVRKTLDELQSLVANTKTPNRDVLFALFTYYRFIQYSSEADSIALAEFEKLYKERFSLDCPEIIFLHKIETCINQGNITKALSLIKQGSALFPNCIPIQVYSWQLEENKTLKEQKYKSLKQKYPNHWIVKQI